MSGLHVRGVGYCMKTRMRMLGSRIDLHLLVVFDAIYRTRNLTTAGRTLALTQSAMSHALGRLRMLFDDPLFVRLPRGLKPTPVADDIAPAVMDGLRTLRGAFERSTFDPATATRTFRLGMGDIAEWVHLPRLREAVRTGAPKVRLHALQVEGPRLRDALGDAEVDVATGAYDAGARCRSVLLYESTYSCVVRGDHPTIRTRLSLEQFRSSEHVLVTPAGAFQHGEIIEKALTSRQLNARIAVQISHLPGVLPLLADSDLIAIIPTRLAYEFRRFSDVRILAPPLRLPKIPVSLYWHERFHRDQANQWLRKTYISTLKNPAES